MLDAWFAGLSNMQQLLQDAPNMQRVFLTEDGLTSLNRVMAGAPTATRTAAARMGGHMMSGPVEVKQAVARSGALGAMLVFLQGKTARGTHRGHAYPRSASGAGARARAGAGAELGG